MHIEMKSKRNSISVNQTQFLLLAWGQANVPNCPNISFAKEVLEVCIMSQCHGVMLCRFATSCIPVWLGQRCDTNKLWPAKHSLEQPHLMLARAMWLHNRLTEAVLSVPEECNWQLSTINWNWKLETSIVETNWTTVTKSVNMVMVMEFQRLNGIALGFNGYHKYQHQISIVYHSIVVVNCFSVYILSQSSQTVPTFISLEMN